VTQRSKCVQDNTITLNGVSGNTLFTCDGDQCLFKDGTVNNFMISQCNVCDGEWFNWDEHRLNVLKSMTLDECKWLPEAKWAE
jgi:hypothetical protein